MTELGLMTMLDPIKYLGQFNGSYNKGNPRDNYEEYEVNPHLLAILHKRRFA